MITFAVLLLLVLIIFSPLLILAQVSGNRARDAKAARPTKRQQLEAESTGTGVRALKARQELHHG
jgi:hypothetical protein